MNAISRAFEVDEPGSWSLDAAHFPTPITPYHAEILQTEFPRGFAEGSARIGLLLSHFDHRIVNGFDYIAPRPVGAPKAAKGPPPYPIFKLLSWLHPEMRRRLRTATHVIANKPWREDVALWQNEVRPRSSARHAQLQAKDPKSCSDSKLAELLRELHANAHHQYYLHHRFTVSAFLPVGDFIAHASDWTGLSYGELLQACRQPRGVATDAQTQFDAAVAALQNDATAGALLANDAPAREVLDDLRAHAGVGESINSWLEMTGLRLVTGYDICDLTALEMPELLVRTLRRAVSGEGMASGKAAREALAARVRDRVPAGKRAEYDALLAEALSVSNLREERALVLDFWAYGLARRAILEAARRLQEKGRLRHPNHLFDASHEEMLSLLVQANGPSAELLAERYAWRTSVTADIAPKLLGFPPSPPPPASWLPPAVRRMSRACDCAVEALFSEPEPRHEPKLVRGLNASAGVYEGPARVIQSAEDFGRINAGDVLVARMTTEAYNGILPLLGAVITDRGGLLSHAATVAREFGIPAVVGTTSATKIIPDGARVRVDGDRGEARLV
jgi:pyruvate,water dikinase